MMLKTHFAIAIFFILLLIGALETTEQKIVFVIVALLATLMPDVDSRFSRVGRPKIARILQFFTKHRGVTHSFSFLFVATLLLIVFFPKIALGFFVGYSIHLFADSFTPDGIKPFYPLRKTLRGKITTGGRKEVMVLVFFIIIDLFLSLKVFI